jgi:excisionase family DNA binding protein
MSTTAGKIMDPMQSQNAKIHSRRTGGHLLTLGEVADVLCVRPRAVVDYVNRGELEGQRVGRSWRFTQDAIDRFFEEPPVWRATDFLSYGE